MASHTLMALANREWGVLLANFSPASAKNSPQDESLPDR